MAGLEELSKRLYRHLDSTGYGMKIIAIRRKIFRDISRNTSARYKMHIVCSGSKGEGMGKLFESDTDVIYHQPGAVCVDGFGSVHLVPGPVTVFNLLNIQPGYCMLELERKGSESYSWIENSLVSYDGKVMLSSQAIKLDINNEKPSQATSSTMTGPAQTNTFPGGAMVDAVATLPCYCQGILEEWSNRPRSNDWPPISVRQTVVHMNGNLVATGRNNSETEHLEWRYCFNEIEMLIIQSLNGTQLKLYKVLKIINKDIFKKQGHSISSFMIKNIVLWMAETHPQSQFLPETLYHNVCESLSLLKHFVETSNVPYYMIPGRNLLTEKVEESDRPKLLQLISDVIDSGPVMLLECETFRKYESLNIHELGVLKQKLQTLELTELYMLYRVALLKNQGQESNKNALLRYLQGVSKQNLSSGWPLQIQQHITGTDPDTATRHLLS